MGWNVEHLPSVYDSGAELPGSDVLPETTPVLVAEPVEWSQDRLKWTLRSKTADLGNLSG